MLKEPRMGRVAGEGFLAEVLCINAESMKLSPSADRDTFRVVGSSFQE